MVDFSETRERKSSTETFLDGEPGFRESFWSLWLSRTS